VKSHDHFSDEDLLLYADGEPGRSSDEITRHLDHCLSCRSRMAELERALATVAEAHANVQDAQLPAPDRARASLKLRMAEIDAANHQNDRLPLGWISLRAMTPRLVQWSTVGVACLSLALLLHFNRPQPTSTLARLWEKPNLHLTPGATVPVTESQICGSSLAASDPEIPISLKEKVLAMYGVKQPQPDQYEIDYLITPELGGATDIRNLWPEPYHDEVWNAHVKDQLEDRLHRMVCRGDVDLATAQHDISTDWIAAYRKYFHVDAPLSKGSSLDAQPAASLPST
jgi:hypothetical protein